MTLKTIAKSISKVNNNKPWYERLEVWGTVLQGLSGLFLLFPAATTVHVVGVALGLIVGTATQVKGLRVGYQSNNLPSGITKVMDKIPGPITGVKGSLNAK